MPVLIVFNSSGGASPEAAAETGEKIQVEGSADGVIRELSDAKSGFAGFQLTYNPSLKVWINRDQVRFVRDTE